METLQLVQSVNLDLSFLEIKEEKTATAKAETISVLKQGLLGIGKGFGETWRNPETLLADIREMKSDGRSFDPNAIRQLLVFKNYKLYHAFLTPKELERGTLTPSQVRAVFIRACLKGKKADEIRKGVTMLTEAL